MEIAVAEIQTEQDSAIIIDRAIMHYLDPKSVEKKLVKREIRFNGANAEVVIDFLSRLIKISYETIDVYGEALEDGSDTLAACWHMIDSPEDFAEQSVYLAERLNEVMEGKGNISKGDMLIVLARDISGPFVAVLKLEQLREFERRYTELPDGSFEVELLLNENVVSSNHIPQKCAFVRGRIYSYSRGYHVELHDNQVRDRDSAAKFFYEDFLKCRLLRTPTKRTIDFCRGAEAWRQKYAQYLPMQGVLAFARALELSLLKAEVSFEDFADHALEGIAHQELSVSNLAQTIASYVYPREAKEMLELPKTFVPDRKTVDNLLKTIDLTLSDDIRVSGPSKSMMHILERMQGGEDDGDRQLSLLIRSASVNRDF